jgi:hypothetical protein
VGRFTPGIGAPAAANALRRAPGVLWIADALVKLSLPFGDQPGEQSYGQIMTAESTPARLGAALLYAAASIVLLPRREERDGAAAPAEAGLLGQ